MTDMVISWGPSPALYKLRIWHDCSKLSSEREESREREREGEGEGKRGRGREGEGERGSPSSGREGGRERETRQQETVKLAIFFGVIRNHSDRIYPIQ